MISLIHNELEKEARAGKERRGASQEHKAHSARQIRKRIERQEEKIDLAKKEFAASVKLCKQLIAAYNRTKDKRKWDKAREIFYKDLIGAPKAYEDI